MPRQCACDRPASNRFLPRPWQPTQHHRWAWAELSRMVTSEGLHFMHIYTNRLWASVCCHYVRSACVRDLHIYKKLCKYRVVIWIHFFLSYHWGVVPTTGGIWCFRSLPSCVWIISRTKPGWDGAHGAASYPTWMKYIYTMQNLTFGSDGGLTATCQEQFKTEPWKCFMSPHMQAFVKTPYFMFNSKFDAWQLANILQTNYSGNNCDDADADAVLQ